MRPSIIVLLAATAALSGWPLPIQESALPSTVCGVELDAATRETDGVEGHDGRRLRMPVERAVTDFRFGRRKEALTKLDAVLELLGGALGQRIPPDDRQALRKAINALWTCVSTSQPPGMAMLTVRASLMDYDKPDSRGAPAGAGVYVKVEGVHVGRTCADGTLTVQVPSGRLRVEALVPSSSWGDMSIDLKPGGSGTVSIALDGDKEVTEETDLVFVEAVDGVIWPTFETFSFKFVHDGVSVPLTKLVDIELFDGNHNSALDLDHLFTLTAGTIVARNSAAVFAALAERAKGDEEIEFRVHAYDAATGFTHANRIRFTGRAQLARGLRQGKRGKRQGKRVQS
jgi:hypothetical protein